LRLVASRSTPGGFRAQALGFLGQAKLERFDLFEAATLGHALLHSVKEGVLITDGRHGTVR